MTEYEKWQIDNMTNGVYVGQLDKVLFPSQDVKNAYEAGAQSERNKHRLIPVTERLPDENDGEVHKNCGWGDRYCDFVKLLVSKEGEKYLSTELFNLTDGKFEECDNKIIAWQPLPEA